MTLSTHRIVHLVYSFGCGGLEKVISNLINHSQHQPNLEHTILSLTDDVSMASELPDNVDVVCLNKKPGKDLLFYYRLYAALKKLSPTVLHTYNFGTIEYHPIAKMAGIKICVHADHGMGGDDPSGQNKSHNMVRKVVAPFIDHYIVVSDVLKTWAINVIGIPKEKVDFVFNGVLVGEARPKYTQGFNASLPFKLLTVGRCVDVKNQEMLIRAYHTAVNKRPDLHIHLTIVGDGPKFDELKQLRDELGMTNNISLPGLQMDIPKYMKACDGFILSSKYEAMPMTVLEAMAQTRPVICPKVGGVCDFINDDEAILTPANDESALADAIISLYDMNESERRLLAVRGHKATSERYNVGSMVERYMEKYGVKQEG